MGMSEIPVVSDSEVLPIINISIPLLRSVKQMETSGVDDASKDKIVTAEEDLPRPPQFEVGIAECQPLLELPILRK